MMTTRQILDADPQMAYLIDSLPDVKWSAADNSTEEDPWVTLTEVILASPVEYIEVHIDTPE